MITLYGDNQILSSTDAAAINFLEKHYAALIESKNVINEVVMPESKKMWANTIANRVFNLLGALRRVPLSGFEEGAKEAYTKCLRLILDTVTEDDFAIDRSFCFRTSEFSTLIGNLAMTCGLPTTQEYIDKVRTQDNSLYKMMLLVSARNSYEEVDNLLSQYEIDIPLFNNWASNLFQVASTGLLSEHVLHILDHVEKVVMKHDFIWGMAVGEMYNTATYRTSPNEKALKTHISKSFQNTFVTARKQRPKTGKIAVYSDNWFDGHSTHRTVAKYIQALKGKYEFTLLHGERLKSIMQGGNFDYSLFKERHQLAVFGVFDPLELGIVGPENVDFDILIYPDAGYDTMSIIFANMRIAPIQISMTGFPSSVFGGKIDYFISGDEVEDESLALENYDERLVLLPGFGAVHTRQLDHYDFTPPVAKDEIVIGGCWVGPKSNYCFLEALNEAIRTTTKSVKLRIFPGIGWFHYNKSYAPYVEQFNQWFDDRVYVEVVDGGEPKVYHDLMNEVDMVVDSHPWGGSNVISDCIHLRKPVIVWEGSRWFNRIGPAMLRSVGLEELIAQSRDEYRDKCARLINDDAWRIDITYRMNDITKPGGLADTKIYDSQPGIDAFAKFIDDLMNDRIQPGKEPIKFR